ncbi:MAG TPA: class I SAM-dependent methyltransferase [Albitalea sp.]|uniref:class I SAM-dependent methyltransferase n=1 Tax=Piscinibacter sp. TaxID=1903157 RepID=UPI002ED128F0
MTGQSRKPYDPEAYWAERYSTIDLTKSGHIDLPVDYNRWLYRRKKERLMQLLQRTGFDVRGASVLDVASGTGVYVEAWKAQGVQRLVGIDISAAATQALQARFPEYAFHKRDLAQPGLAGVVGSGFSLVTAIDMLYHIVDDASFPVALANLHDTLAPGGHFAIHDVFMHGRELDFGYIKLRTLARYTESLQAAGFEIVARRPTFFVSVQGHDHASAWSAGLANGLWDRVQSRLIPRFPDGMGRLAYWIDRGLGAVLDEGPSFEMMICRRPAR